MRAVATIRPHEIVRRPPQEELDPGSRAKRYIAGFGAGAAHNKVRDGTRALGEDTAHVITRF